jgi:TolB protein
VKALLLVVLALAASAGGAGAAPSGALIAFQTDRPCHFNECGRSEIATIRPSGTGLRVLTHNRFDEYSPAWSPDRRSIAFARILPAGTRIYVMRADGSGLHVLASSRPGDTTPSWSPDGRRLAVRGSGLARSFDLYTIAATGTARTRLMATRANELYPSWSRDGRTIAYQSDRSGGIQIWTLTLSNRRQHQLTRGVTSQMPDFSPSGRPIAFVRGGGIWVVGADGRGARAIGSGLPASAESPSWSPDGRQIAFSRNYQVLAMNATGGGRHYVTRAAPGTVNLQPDW